jgi:hypothetical protein
MQFARTSSQSGGVAARLHAKVLASNSIQINTAVAERMAHLTLARAATGPSTILQFSSKPVQMLTVTPTTIRAAHSPAKETLHLDTKLSFVLNFFFNFGFNKLKSIL